MQVEIKKLFADAKLPTYGSACAAGADLYAHLDGPITIAPNETAFIGTGLAMKPPKGYACYIVARSGLSCKRGLAPANKIGVCDEDYRGEYIVALHNHGTSSQVVEPEERIAQLLVLPYEQASFMEVSTLNETKRGDGGFGSTGNK